jgi:hypothetical protein
LLDGFFANFVAVFEKPPIFTDSSFSISSASRISSRIALRYTAAGLSITEIFGDT